ncbi:hypothetical protein MTO96_016133 [Rhipicephalus appendiculatus]
MRARVPFMAGFTTRSINTNRGAFDPPAPSARTSCQHLWRISYCCLEPFTAAMQVPPLPSTELLQTKSAASLVLFQPESIAATLPATQRMTSVTAAVELPEGCTSGRLGFRRRRYREPSSAASA